MLKHKKHLALAFFLLLLIGMIGCNESSDDSAGDGDIIDGDQDKTDGGSGVCEPEALRCRPGEDLVVEICQSDGSGWAEFRRCSEGQVCYINACKAIDTDGDKPAGDTTDGDTPDGDTPDGDTPDGDTPDGDMDIEYSGRCLPFCEKYLECYPDDSGTLGDCMNMCQTLNLPKEVTDCAEHEDCASYGQCVDAILDGDGPDQDPDSTEARCERFCRMFETCDDVVYGICYDDCLQTPPAESLLICGDETECSAFNQCVGIVDGDLDEEEWPEREMVDYEYQDGEASVANCWNHPEMVPVNGSFCIDRYEATVRANADCTGTIYGQNEDDYPSGFGNCVSCLEDEICYEWEKNGKAGGVAGCATDDASEYAPQSTPLYACSEAGVLPSRFITWYQANKACENSGKSLCARSDWEAACMGPQNLVFPYGNNVISGLCYDETASDASGINAPTQTGVMSGCYSDYGIFDMSGNVEEWLYEYNEYLRAYATGGFWQISSSSNLDCNVETGSLGNMALKTASELTGFRCCKYSPQ